MIRDVRVLAVLATLLLGRGAFSQPADADTTVALEGVEVTAAPFALESARAPLALAVRTRSAVEMATAAAVTLDDIARGVPGLWVSDRENYALGERLLVRGLGWRAAFGVRGTHVLLDGVPLTLPDGQAMLNVVDPAAVRQIEVVRGPASVFWGSGSGGVLALSTRPADGGPRLRVRGLGGGYGLAKADVAAHPDLGRHRLSAWGSALTEEGFRDHSAVRLARAGLSSRFDLGGGRTLSAVLLAAHMPEAESPGGISAEAAAADPTQTREIAVTQNASKALTQTHLALGYLQPVGGVPGGRFSASLYGGLRDLDNPIVPRYIDLNRRAAGLRLALEVGTPDGWNVGIGAEGEVQRDDRLETSNDAGEPGEDVLTDQVETVQAGALFTRIAVPLGMRALTLTAAARLDALRYEADDRVGIGTASGSGARAVTALSPALGLAYRWRAGRAAGLLYANAAGALDAPTTTELGNRPDGSAGFNPDLDPERTWGIEAGTRGAVTVGRGTAGFDVAVFSAWVDRLLLPFEIDDVTFYRNAGRTRHAGLETALDVAVPDVLRGSVEAAVSYAWTQARFTEDADVVRSGAEVPGFPEHLVGWTARWQHRHGLPLVVAVEGEAASAYFADDANTAATDAYAVVHARMALAGLALGRGLSASPFLSLRNVLDAEYAGSVVVNAFGARYYEPAAGRHVLVGLTLSLD
jgi:iron complex outermembrane receptor protein